MSVFKGFILGFIIGFYTVNQSERAVKTVFVRAERAGMGTIQDGPLAQSLSLDEKSAYCADQALTIYTMPKADLAARGPYQVPKETGTLL